MSTATDGGDDADPPGPGPDPEAIALAIGDLEQQRKWITSIKGLTDSAYTDPFANPNVQIAYEDMLIAAFERLERILNSDRSYCPRGADATQS
jgi:hypothetical protein